MEYFRCGKILTTHGIKGDLKVLSVSDFDRFQKGKKLKRLYRSERAVAFATALSISARRRAWFSLLFCTIEGKISAFCLTRIKV